MRSFEEGADVTSHSKVKAQKKQFLLRVARFKTLTFFLSCFSILAASASAQNIAMSVFLTDKSTVPSGDILKSLRKGCPSVSITSDAAKSDYTLEAVKMKVIQDDSPMGPSSSIDFVLTLQDRDGIAFGAEASSLGKAARDVCHAIKMHVIVEVEDRQNLTQSADMRSNGTVVGALTGRRTHTDTSSIYVVVKGEHALLDCYERRTGCTTIALGKYYGELEGDGIWVSYQIPLTHRWVRNHYKIAGSW
jgi:hypothetical protein